MDNNRECLMWEYCAEIGSDSIVGLHVCDDYLAWEKQREIEQLKEDFIKAALRGDLTKAFSTLTG